jgi:acetyl-CoA synthetase
MSTTTEAATVLPVYLPSAEFVKNAAIPSMDAYNALCKEAETDYEGFWGRLAKELISWKVPFTQTLDESNAPFFKWFADGTAQCVLQLPGPQRRKRPGRQNRHHF